MRPQIKNYKLFNNLPMKINPVNNACNKNHLMYVCIIHAILFDLQSHVLCISIAYRIIEYCISPCLQKSSFNIFCGPITSVYTKSYTEQVWFSTVITLRLKIKNLRPLQSESPHIRLSSVVGYILQ